MAFDGSAVAALVCELNKKILDAHIAKVVQPEKDELLLTIKKDKVSYRLLISVNPSLPVMYLTDENKAAPLQAPAFCMLLRKHIQGGQIIKITQPSMERIVDFEIEHYNEMGDICIHTLTVELMGKHSNIIFRDGDKILDSIRHVSSAVSSVREVLPGREYFIPFGGDKLDPFKTTKNEITERLKSCSVPLAKALYSNITGVSPQMAEEAAYRAGADSDMPAAGLSGSELDSVAECFVNMTALIKAGDLTPEIVFEAGRPKDFTPIEYKIYSNLERKQFDSFSELLRTYYSRRQESTNIKQKTTDLRHNIQTILNRDYRKLDLQKKQIKDTEKKDKYKVYGELLTAYGYSAEPRATFFDTVNFYTGENVRIPLDPTMSAVDNGKKYFEKYSKLKRTYDALAQITQETEAEIEHLESILASLDTVENEADIADIKREMTDSGYMKSRGRSDKKGKKERTGKSTPMHFVSSDGFDMYVGKNNYQNEDLTFRLATGEDWWFHAKKIPGSHVILKSGGRQVPDRTFEEAASLAAHFSKAAGADKAEVDYVQRKHIKKPGGAKPGFVIYHTNYSMTADTDISSIREV